MNEIIEANITVPENVTPEHAVTEVHAPTAAESYIDNMRLCFSLAKTYCQSGTVPDNYRGKVADTAIAIDMASRIGVHPLMVMQNLYVVKGKPSWSGQACMSFIRNKYKNVKPVYVGEEGKDTFGCYVKATDSDGDTLIGTTVTIAMAKSEGWYSKSGSKWQTMAAQMLAYRAAAFFARVYCPEVLMGCQVEGEAEDSQPAKRITEDLL